MSEERTKLISSDLFACPFCGEKPEVVYCEEVCCGAMPRIVECKCGAELHGEGQDLFRRWNFRANVTTQAPL